MDPIIMVLFLSLTGVSGDDITLVQKYDIAELMMQKHVLSVEEGDYTIFYRLSTAESHAEGTAEDLDAKITSMGINKERTSLMIMLEGVGQTDIMSVRFPNELLSAQGGKFTLLVDGKQRGYESSEQEGKTNMIFLIPSRSKEIEIIGTRVIPEFQSAIILLVATFLATLIVPLAKSQIKK
ncbi:MAG TPA: hypothetical protein VNK44_05385 [Candidatus Nitrosotenuis sp.]|nr:hypothetical protein [Candidatus Nitrosotenuis sp.]